LRQNATGKTGNQNNAPEPAIDSHGKPLFNVLNSNFSTAL
jgi:hypothetical protein